MVGAYPSDHAASAPEQRYAGVLITLGTLLAIEVLNRTIVRVPTPGAILLVPVAYAAFTGGLRAGLISATLMFLYALYFFASPGPPWHYTTANLQTIIVLALVAAAMVGMVGSLKQRVDQLIRHNHLILHSAGEGICGLDNRGRVTFLNPAAARLCGWTAQELLGQPVQVLVQSPHPNGPPASGAALPNTATLPDQLAHALAEGVFWRKDGTSFPVEYIRSPIWQSGAMIGAVVTFRDISDRKRAEATLRLSEERFAKAFRASPAALTITRLTDGCFLDVNESFLSLFGYRRDEVIGQRSLALNMYANPDERAELVRRLREQGSVRNYEMTTQTKSSELRRVLFSTELFELDGEACILATIVDITDRQRAEEQVRKLNAELETRVVERTAALEATNKELEAFSYSVSHDLRAPLRRIDGFSLALLEDYGATLDAQGQDLLQRVRTAAQHMGDMIDGLLNLSHLTRGQLRSEPVDLSFLAQTLVAELRQSEPTRQVEIDIAEGLRTSGDVRLLRVVLENLLGNAWKFTAKCSQPKIEVGILPEAQDKPVYFVRDNGAGFNMAYADRLFGAFQRLHVTSEFAGTGIGLATVQRIIHRHDGRIWAESAEGQGATFYFTL